MEKEKTTENAAQTKKEKEIVLHIINSVYPVFSDI
jgi:hypothetical protein